MWPSNPAWATDAPEELLGELSEIDRFASDHMDARVTMDAPENSRDGSDIPSDRFQLTKQAEHYFFRRTMASEIPWVSCAFPTEALAQDAGLTLGQFEDVLYGALPDRLGQGNRADDAVRRALRRCRRRCRSSARGTDLTLSLAGRRGRTSTTATTTCPAGSSSTRRSRIPPTA